MFLTILSIVSAATTEISLNPKENHVLLGENAVFTLTLKNNDFEDKIYSIKSSDLNWLSDSESVSVPAYSSRDVTLTFKPLSDLTPKNYGINLLVESDRDKIETFLPVKLLRYDEILDVALSTPDFIDPRKETIITLNVKNNYRVDLKDLSMELLTPAFKKEAISSIGYFGEINKDFSVTFNEAQAGAYKVRAIIKSGNNVLVDKNIEVTIGSVGALKEEISEDKSFFITTAEIKKINEANSKIQELYTRDMNLLQLWFTQYNPQPDSIETKDNKYVASWQLDIQPKETFVIKATTNYRTPLILLIVLLIIIYLTYNWKVKSIAITKKVLVIHSSKDSATIKVVIGLRNRTGRVIKNIRLTDKVHNVTKEPTEFTLKPTKVGRMANTTAMFWDIPLLGKKQERMISYRVECKMHERLTLPSATVWFEDKGKGIKTNTGSTTVTSK